MFLKKLMIKYRYEALISNKKYIKNVFFIFREILINNVIIWIILILKFILYNNKSLVFPNIMLNTLLMSFIIIFFDELGHYTYVYNKNVETYFGFYCYEFKFIKIKIIFFISINDNMRIYKTKTIKNFYFSGFISGFFTSIFIFLCCIVFYNKLLIISSINLIIMHLIFNLIIPDSDLNMYFNILKKGV